MFKTMLPDSAESLVALYRSQLPGWETVPAHAIKLGVARSTFFDKNNEDWGPEEISTSLLAEACVAGRCDHVQLLLSSGVSPDLGWGLWRLACAPSTPERLKAAELLLGSGAGIEKVPDPKKNTSPFQSSLNHQESPELSTLLLTYGARIEIAGEESSLVQAVVKGWSGLFQMMVLAKSEDPALSEELNGILEWIKTPGFFCRPRLSGWLHAFITSRAEIAVIEASASSCEPRGPLPKASRL